METRPVSTRAASGPDDSHLPHVHSTHRNSTVTTTQGQGQGQGRGPWKHYQLKIVDGLPTGLPPPVKADDDARNQERPTLDPAIRAGCVPAPAYPSFRTLPPPAAARSYRTSIPRVSELRLLYWFISWKHVEQPILPSLKTLLLKTVRVYF